VSAVAWPAALARRSSGYSLGGRPARARAGEGPSSWCFSVCCSLVVATGCSSHHVLATVGSCRARGSCHCLLARRRERAAWRSSAAAAAAATARADGCSPPAPCMYVAMTGAARSLIAIYRYARMSGQWLAQASAAARRRWAASPLLRARFRTRGAYRPAAAAPGVATAWAVPVRKRFPQRV